MRERERENEAEGEEEGGREDIIHLETGSKRNPAYGHSARERGNSNQV